VAIQNAGTAVPGWYVSWFPAVNRMPAGTCRVSAHAWRCSCTARRPRTQPITLPLIEVRMTLRLLTEAAGRDDAGVALVLAALERMWFGDRTWGALRNLLIRHTAAGPAALDRLSAALAGPARIKTVDLDGFLTGQPEVSCELLPGGAMRVVGRSTTSTERTATRR
jgi:hypothetical protein